MGRGEGGGREEEEREEGCRRTVDENDQFLLLLPLHPYKEILKQCPLQGNWNQVNFVDNRSPVPVCVCVHSLSTALEELLHD